MGIKSTPQTDERHNARMRHPIARAAWHEVRELMKANPTGCASSLKNNPRSQRGVRMSPSPNHIHEAPNDPVHVFAAARDSRGGGRVRRLNDHSHGDAVAQERLRQRAE